MEVQLPSLKPPSRSAIYAVVWLGITQRMRDKLFRDAFYAPFSVAKILFSSLLTLFSCCTLDCAETLQTFFLQVVFLREHYRSVEGKTSLSDFLQSKYAFQIKILCRGALVCCTILEFWI